MTAESFLRATRRLFAYPNNGKAAASGPREHGAEFQSVWTAYNLGQDSREFSEPVLTADERATVDAFHRIYYGKEGAQPTVRTYFLSWLGYEMFKCPLDLWVYQEIIAKQKPDLIVETGTYRGGSALFLATICDLMGHGRVVTVDIDSTLADVRPKHPRITYLTGSSVDPDILLEIAGIAAERTLVILDSDHHRDHVLAELRAYSRFVQPGGYLVVEDTNINGHPAYDSFGPGPWEAVDAFLSEQADFFADRSCERFLMTMNPRGFLRRRVQPP